MANEGAITFPDDRAPVRFSYDAAAIFHRFTALAAQFFKPLGIAAIVSHFLARIAAIVTPFFARILPLILPLILPQILAAFDRITPIVLALVLSLVLAAFDRVAAIIRTLVLLLVPLQAFADGRR
jgi:hypothetical protein